MGDLDDGPEQKPLDRSEVEEAILRLIPSLQYDLIISHNPGGEYTRHLRHEETGKAVISLWQSGKLSTKELWTFAYEDGRKQFLPRAVKKNTLYHVLPRKTWKIKYNIITEIFGFSKDSWEAKTTPKEESFRKYTNSNDAMNSLINEGKR
jgi:LmbE family N-acetylglucosaminyl deacetylase